MQVVTERLLQHSSDMIQGPVNDRELERVLGSSAEEWLRHRLRRVCRGRSHKCHAFVEGN